MSSEMHYLLEQGSYFCYHKNMASLITRLVQILTNFIKLDLNTVLAKIAERLAYFPLGGYHPGLYEVLEHEGRLELCDVDGHQVVYARWIRSKEDTAGYNGLVIWVASV